MRKLLSLFVALAFGYCTQAQTVLFTDDFESGTTNWTTTGSWGLNTTHSHSPSHSLSESPSGNYSNNWNTYCTMANGVDLSTYPSASLSFWGTYKIESGFDYMYIDISTDNFTTFTTIATYSGNESVALPAFQQYTYDLGGFCGNANVKVRFHFYSDGGYTTDGMYIDDFTITASSIDNSAPLIVHTPTPFYEGTLNSKVVDAQIIDFSGINLTNTYLGYIVDGGAIQQVSGTLISGNNYQFTIPAQTPGAMVKYFIHAEDSYSTPNVAVSDTFKYVAGNHIIQDNGVVDYFMQVGPGVTTGPSEGAAVKVALGGTDLVGMLIRNYTDVDHPNDSMLIHVWDDNNGVPGNDVITPFMAYPAATLTSTSEMKWIDLRPYSSQLSNLSGTYYIGFTVPTGIVNITISQPGTYARSYIKTSTGWSASSGTGGANDHHFRAITSLNQDIEGPNIVNNTIPVHCEATLSTEVVNATITDMSGVASTTLYYQIDNGTTQSVVGVNQSGSSWNYTIPAQTAGAWVKYWIEATDVVTPTPYTSHTDTFLYISGVYHSFDNNQPDVYIPVGTLSQNYAGVAELLDLGNSRTQVTTVLIRNYYSSSNPTNTPNNPMRIHVWNDNAGVPGTELITSFLVNSAANAGNPLGLTKVDLRPYAAQLSNLTGNVYVGFSVDSGSCAVLGTQTGTYQHTFANDGTQWIPDQTDAQIRIITSELVLSAPVVDLNNIIDVYPNPTSDMVNIYIDKFENAIINVYNIQGKIVKTINVNESNTLINTSDWNKGLYFVQISNNAGVSTHKLVVK